MKPTKNWAIAFGILVLYFAVLLFRLPSAPLTDDDDFYLPAGKTYVSWWLRAATFDFKAWNKQQIDAYFQVNREHPPVAKYGLGFSGLIFSPILGPISGPRVSTVFFSTLAALSLLWMAIVQLQYVRGLIAGGLGVLFLLVLPRFSFHSQVGTLDVPVAAMYCLTAACALQAQTKRWSIVLLGVVFGLAAATKLNAPFFVVPYFFFSLLVNGFISFDSSKQQRWSLKLPVIPLGFISMAIIGPLVFVLVWPWMWFDIVQRVQDYVAFHLHHYGIYFLYFGQVYDSNPFAPWHAPWVMAAITVPLSTSILAIYGLFFGLKPIWRCISKTGEDDKEGVFVLWCGLHALCSIGVVSLSGGAKYGGAKLFMPFFPFWCLLAGYGALRLLELFGTYDIRQWRKNAFVYAAISLSIFSGVVLIARTSSVPLSQYNGLVGGLRGATQVGFERQYYDLAYRDMVSWIAKAAPHNAKVHFLPNNWEYIRTFKWYKREGSIRSDISVVRNPQEAHWIILTHERRFKRYTTDLLGLRSWKVLKEKVVDGVPLWTALERP